MTQIMAVALSALQRWNFLICDHFALDHLYLRQRFMAPTDLYHRRLSHLSDYKLQQSNIHKETTFVSVSH